MTTILGIGLAFLVILSVLLVRRAAYVFRSEIVPFQIHIHTPAAMDALSARAHDELHDKLDRYQLRLTGCTLGTCVGTVTGLLAFALYLYGSTLGLLGFTSIVAFSFVLVNITVNTEIVNWIHSVESDILTKIILKKAEAGGFTNLREYLRSENDKLIQEQTKAVEEMLSRGALMMAEFEKVMVEVGIDLSKDHDASDEDFAEFKRLLALAEAKMNERHPELRDRDWMQADKITRRNRS